MESQDNFAYLLPFILATFGCVFLAAGRYDATAARYWGLGYLSAAAGFVSPIALQTLPVELAAVISNLLFFAAFFFYAHALLVRFERPRLVAWRLLFAALALGVVFYLIIVKQDLRAQLVIGDASLALLLAVPVWTVWSLVKRPVDQLLLAMAALVVLETVIRISVLLLMTSASDYASFDDFLSSDYAYLMQVTASVIGFLMALAVLGSVMWDVVDRHRQAAEQDSLTGLLNRRGFHQAVANIRGARTLEGAVIVGDIDHFKRVNDRFGHAAGDAVILALAEILKKRLPDDAVVARFGGEEFVAVVCGSNGSRAGNIAEDIRSEFARRTWVFDAQESGSPPASAFQA